MTDNPLLTGEVITSDGREAVVLEQRTDGLIEFAYKHSPDNWFFGRADLKGTGRANYPSLIPKPAVHPNVAGTRTWETALHPSNEWASYKGSPNFPRVKLTLTDGDPASAVVKVVLPKGEG